MNYETSRIDFLVLAADDVAMHVNLDQVGSTYFIEAEAVRVDQKMMLRARDTDRRVGPDQFGPAKVVDNTVSGGQLDAKLLDLPLAFPQALLQRTYFGREFVDRNSQRASQFADDRVVLRGVVE